MGNMPINPPKENHTEFYAARFHEVKRSIFKKKTAEEVATANAVDQIITAFKKEGMTVPKTLLDVSILKCVTIIAIEISTLP